MMLVRLYPHITPEQKDLIQMYDYGGILDIKISKLHPRSCKLLMDSFDSTSCQMVFPGRGSIPITEDYVYEVMGPPSGFLEMVYKRDAPATAFIKEQLGNPTRTQPTVASPEEKLVSMRPGNSKFMRLFITFVVSSVLAPTTGICISPRVYPSMVNIKEAKNLNMCKFVIKML
jgi:hypothetical protein